MTDPSLLESLMKEVTEEIRKLWDTLMGLEMELVDQLEVLDSSSMSFFRCKIPIKWNPENDKHWIFFQVFFTEIHVYQSSIFLFPRLLFPSLCSVINLKCISKLNNYYELFHQVSHKKYKPVKVFFFINQFLACKSFSFFSSLNAHTSFKSTTSGHFKGSSSVCIISKLTYSFLLTGHTERFWT